MMLSKQKTTRAKDVQKQTSGLQISWHYVVISGTAFVLGGRIWALARVYEMKRESMWYLD